MFRPRAGVDLIREADRVAAQQIIELEAAQVMGAGRCEGTTS